MMGHEYRHMDNLNGPNRTDEDRWEEFWANNTRLKEWLTEYDEKEYDCWACLIIELRWLIFQQSINSGLINK